jgi:putative transposase
MAWKATDVMEERMKFIATLLEGEISMAALCRHYGISRKTGHKLWQRYQDWGFDGLADRSRAPLHHPHAVTQAVQDLLLDARALHPTWGPLKLRAFVHRHHPTLVLPVPSTIGELLRRHGITRTPKRHRRATPSAAPPFAASLQPNGIWCIDFKGWFRTQDRQRCDPLTLTDAASRFLLRCRIVPRTNTTQVRSVLESAFREYGLPDAMRSDNGPPFASTAFGGLSRMSIWWIQLGIKPQRIEPGKPEQNGRHERMHLTLKDEAANPPATSLRQQQRTFDRWREEYNEQRPHEALQQQTPAQCYRPSLRPYPRRLVEITYPETMTVRSVRPSGEFNWAGRRLYLSEALAGQPIGLEPLNGPYWRIYYSDVALGLLNEKTFKLLREPLPKRSRRTITEGT